MSKFLGPMTEDAERRSRLQRMNKSGADKTFVRGEKLELTVHEGKEPFFKGCLAQAGIIANGSNGLVHLLLEEMQRDVFLGPEIIEDSAFGDPSLPRDGFSRGRVEAFRLKESQGGSHNPLSDRFLVLCAAPYRSPPRRFLTQL